MINELHMSISRKKDSASNKLCHWSPCSSNMFTETPDVISSVSVLNNLRCFLTIVLIVTLVILI